MTYKDRMRVIAGTAKGRKLVAPPGNATRPTPARVREALFSILAAHLSGAAVLDIFAGTGSLGMEALSRGARVACFIESDRRALAALCHNVKSFGGAAEVLAMPATAALNHLARLRRRFDLVFMDPPYTHGLLAPVLASVAAAKLLKEDGVIVCEHHGHTPAPPAPPGFTAISTRIFGDVAISLFGQNAK